LIESPGPFHEISACAIRGREHFLTCLSTSFQGTSDAATSASQRVLPSRAAFFRRYRRGCDGVSFAAAALGPLIDIHCTALAPSALPRLHPSKLMRSSGSERTGLILKAERHCGPARRLLSLCGLRW
jgi:hypothetical protein